MSLLERVQQSVCRELQWVSPQEDSEPRESASVPATSRDSTFRDGAPRQIPHRLRGRDYQGREGPELHAFMAMKWPNCGTKFGNLAPTTALLSSESLVAIFKGLDNYLYYFGISYYNSSINGAQNPILMRPPTIILV